MFRLIKQDLEKLQIFKNNFNNFPSLNALPLLSDAQLNNPSGWMRMTAMKNDMTACGILQQRHNAPRKWKENPTFATEKSQGLQSSTSFPFFASCIPAGPDFPGSWRTSEETVGSGFRPLSQHGLENTANQIFWKSHQEATVPTIIPCCSFPTNLSNLSFLNLVPLSPSKSLTSS